MSGEEPHSSGKIQVALLVSSSDRSSLILMEVFNQLTVQGMWQGSCEGGEPYLWWSELLANLVPHTLIDEEPLH